MTRIIGYTYKAEEYTPESLFALLNVPYSVDEDGYSDIEEYLDEWAAEMGIDRADEYSFDSDQFPKVAFAGAGWPDRDGYGACGVLDCADCY